MTNAEQLADFVRRASYEDISAKAREQLKLRILDSLGCAIGALNGEPIQYLRDQIKDFGGNPQCTLIAGGKTSPDRAAFYNSALVRYLDFNDSYFAVAAKFERLSDQRTSSALRGQLFEAIHQLESVPARQLTRLLAEVSLDRQG
jgi:hypothetical protein